MEQQDTKMYTKQQNNGQVLYQIQQQKIMLYLHLQIKSMVMPYGRHLLRVKTLGRTHGIVIPHFFLAQIVHSLFMEVITVVNLVLVCSVSVGHQVGLLLAMVSAWLCPYYRISHFICIILC